MVVKILNIHLDKKPHPTTTKRVICANHKSMQNTGKMLETLAQEWQTPESNTRILRPENIDNNLSQGGNPMMEQATLSQLEIQWWKN